MDFQRLGERFGISGRLAAWQEICAGNINRSYEVSFAPPEGGSCDKYIFQRINTYVFKNPEDVMHNILNVTEHIKKKLSEETGGYERRVLSFLTAEDGHPYLYTNERDFWRVYRFVDDARAYDMIEKPVHFYEAGRAFGEFQGWLSDFPVGILVETIPHFHDTVRRMADFRRAVRENQAGRRDEAEDEIAFILDRENEAGTIVELLASGDIPYRVTHNDTKINNILFDAATDKALCVIDLDTVMPGTSVYDFGDAVRSGASTAREDEEDLSKVHFDLGMFERFTKGFLEETRGLLTPEEIRLLPLGAKIITLELASRFLADYLDGDVYFKIHRPDHNLVRARNQIRLVQEMEETFPDMEEIVSRYGGVPVRCAAGEGPES